MTRALRMKKFSGDLCKVLVGRHTHPIAMAVGGADVTLDPARDTLVNVNAFGQAVPSARFMGGREHDLLLEGQLAEPTEADMAEAEESPEA